MCVARKSTAPESQFLHSFLYRQQLALGNKPSVLESVLKAASKTVSIIQTAAPEWIFSMLCQERQSKYKTLLLLYLARKKDGNKNYSNKGYTSFFNDTDKVSKKFL